ncbi:MAG: hypothetical protein MUF73_13500 [Rhodobacteraceae bacterium]|jgi:hypothetical protein|nr:hypothetical protein [Paracoccaceae bacterium]
MRAAAAFLAALGLAGCVAGPGPGPGSAGAPGGAVPQAAILYPGTLTVLTSDGAMCAGVRPRGAAAWQGQLQGCPGGLSYAVVRPGRGAREVLPSVPDAALAAVTVAGPGRTWAFGAR